MKYLLIIVLSAFSLNLFGQSGTYVREPNLVDGTKIKWTLTLNPDGTFLYNFFRDVVGELNPEENFYGKGTWKSENKTILFFADKNKDIDETYTKNFNNSKALIKRKHPRDKSDRIIKTSIRFYSSEIMEIPGLELFLKES